MQEKYADEGFLARWLTGELSEEELAGFQASDVYKQIMAIDHAVGSLTLPEIDTEKALSKVTAEIRKPKILSPAGYTWWVPALAASLALLFGVYSYFFSLKTYTTGIGEEATILLADGSTVGMNANSKLSHKRFGWLDDRKVHFDGEAYFEVQPGGDFTVVTSGGTVSVVGTRFNVRVRRDLKVQCYDGSVVFTPANTSFPASELSRGMEIIMKGDKIRHTGFTGKFPDWKQGFSSFSEQPFADVVEELAIQFPVTFQLDSVQTDRLFTGQFSHNSLEGALKTTMEPMGIKYHISSDKRMITLSE